MLKKILLILSAVVLFAGGTMSAPGVTPKLHVIIAPAVTSFPIDNFRFRFNFSKMSGGSNHYLHSFGSKYNRHYL